MSERSLSADCLVVGGGIIGLSIARELATRGRRVLLIDRQRLGREASWAGAGILPPGSWYSDQPWADELARLSYAAYERWAQELGDATGIDVEFSRCGALYFVEPAAAGTVAQRFARWQQLGIEVEPLSPADIARCEPELQSARFADHSVWHVPSEAQVRNPRLLAAVTRAAQLAGVEIRSDCQATGLTIESGRCLGVATAHGPIAADHVIVASGAWASGLLEPLELPARVKPVRGQMLLLKEATPSLRGVVHVVGQAATSGYVVPRRDGHTIVGSTVEDVGFDKSTTAESIDHFRALARSMTAGLAEATEVAAWSGLRPAAAREQPYIGPVPGVDRLLAAVGHFRSGLQFAPPTAALIGSFVDGGPPPLDPSPFAIAL